MALGQLAACLAGVLCEYSYSSRPLSGFWITLLFCNPKAALYVHSKFSRSMYMTHAAAAPLSGA